MQFSKLLPAVLVVVGVCTWSFMAAQDEYPDAGSNSPRVPQARNSDEVQRDDSQYYEEPEQISPLPSRREPARKSQIIRVAARKVRNVDIAATDEAPPSNVAAGAGPAPADLAASVPDAPSGITIRERQAKGSTTPGDEIQTSSKQTLVTLQLGMTDATQASAVKQIEVRIAYTDGRRPPSIKPFEIGQFVASGTLISINMDFGPNLNMGELQISARVRANGDWSPFSQIKTIEFKDFPLPPIRINSVNALMPDGDSETGSIKISPTDPLTNRSRFSLELSIDNTNSPEIDAVIKSQPVKIRLLNGGTQVEEKIVTPFTSNLSGTVIFDLGDRYAGPLQLSVQYQPMAAHINLFRTGLSNPSLPFPVLIDKTPPRFIDARLVSPNQLEIRFREADLGSGANAKASYMLASTANGISAPVLSDVGEIRGASVLFFLTAVPPTGTFTIAPNANRVKDKAGNAMSDKDLTSFSSAPDRERGVHVPFPEFVNRSTVRDSTRVFNPGDKVETRVARLYYYRDAHRVAEIINRNVRSYDRAAVKITEQEAERARDDAVRLTGERQASERQAIFEAQQTRIIERDIQQKERELAAMQADRVRQNQRLADAEKAATEAQAAQDVLTARKNATAPGAATGTPAVPDPMGAATPLSPDAELSVATTLKAAKAQVVTESAKLESLKISIQTANDALTQMNANATASRNAEFKSREKVATSEFEEDRARASQFRKEVAAASADPDTYVPGEVDSLDPVTQVSISVIGEGLIQLRGPIRGINTIREMISQIDTPVGQVKVGIHTVQINGEHGDRMENVAARIEASLKLGQNLTSQSLMLLRRAIQEVAAETVDLTNSQFPGGNRQVDRDRRYLYNFFGRDFTNELYEMDSEFLRTENKLLGLHSMDTLSIAQAMFIMALAKNDIRQAILQRFRHLVMCELPEAEWDHRRTTKLLPRKFNTLEEVVLNANARYHFRNLYAFVNAQVAAPETLTPTQREFLRLAQIFKSQMVAEMEYKQRVMERGLLEDRSNSEDAMQEALRGPHDRAINLIGAEFEKAVNQADALQTLWENKEIQFPLSKARYALDNIRNAIATTEGQFKPWADLVQAASRRVGFDTQSLQSFKDNPKQPGHSKRLTAIANALNVNDNLLKKGKQFNFIVGTILFQFGNELQNNSDFLSNALLSDLKFKLTSLTETHLLTEEKMRNEGVEEMTGLGLVKMVLDVEQFEQEITTRIQNETNAWNALNASYKRFRELVDNSESDLRLVQAEHDRLQLVLDTVIANLTGKEIQKPMIALSNAIRDVFDTVRSREVRIKSALAIEKRTRGNLDHRKIMEFHIDEQAEKVVELAEGTRSHIAQIDNYLKRMFIALEDDFQAQFYDPAFEDVRRASRMWDVNLGQVERTTLLGNNRTLMKVSPQATMEFDLPKRHTAIFEGMAVAKAAYQEYGALVSDPNFLGLAKMASGSPAVGGDSRFTGPGGTYRDTMQNPSVKNVLPGLGGSPDEQMFSQVAGNKTQFGAALEGLIPDPAVYKFETGTGFEIRPVMQPDGSSLVFDFDYMYTTNVREPIRADEKHLGRVKRHFIHTQVQTTSFELREIGRYLVSLKASRTSRGVPLLEDAPVIGGLFRPLPSAESSLQQNIILSQSMAYPTLFDLMGLRWSKHLVDLDHVGLRDSEHVVRGRYKTVRDFTFDESAKNFDEFLDIEKRQPDHFRKDLYHRNSVPSPYHPGGYHNSRIPDERDPTGQRFNVPDNRPPELQDPYYDPKFRRPIDAERTGPGQLLTPQSVGPGERIPENPSTGSPSAMRTVPRGHRTSTAPLQLITPDSDGAVGRQVGPPSDPTKSGPIFGNNVVEGSPTTSFKRTRSSIVTKSASNSTPGPLKWVVDEHPSAVGRAKVEGYQDIEARYLPKIETKRGLPSLKQIFGGSKAIITPKSWDDNKPAIAPKGSARTSVPWPQYGLR